MLTPPYPALRQSPQPRAPQRPRRPAPALGSARYRRRRHFLTCFDSRDHFRNAVDDAEHGADQRPVRNAPSRAAIGERIFSRVAERFEPREFEEAAIALHRMDEAEDAIEPGAVVRLGFPGDDLARPALRAFRGIRLRNRQSSRPLSEKPQCCDERRLRGRS